MKVRVSRGKRETQFIKQNMSIDVDFPSGRMKASITLILLIVAKKHTLQGLRIKLVCRHKVAVKDNKRCQTL